MPKKVYISSTFRDLKEYRLKAANTLRFLGGYFEIVRIMEFMMPDGGQPPLKSCLEDVGSADIYILIIGKRYGSLAEDTNYSFTELEYREAVKCNKIIIPLVADLNADWLKDIETDDEANFNRFRAEIKTNYTSFIEDFINIYQLGEQLSLSLFKYADNNWGLNERAATKCDRQTQYLDMINNTHQGALNLFTLVCKRRVDRPEVFIQRMAEYEFGFQKEFINQSIELSTIIANVSNHTEHRKRFVRQMLDSFIAPDESTPESIIDGLKILVSQKIKRFFMYFSIGIASAADELTIRSIHNILIELGEACASVSMTFYLVFVFPFPKEGAPDLQVTNMLVTGIDLSFVSLGVMPKVTDNDVQNWMRRYVTTNNISIQKALDKLFEERDEYYMSEIYEQLVKIKEITG